MKLFIAVSVICLTTLIPNSVSAQDFELPLCDPDTDVKAPCRLELNKKAPWAGTLILEDDLIKMEASLRILEQSVKILDKGLQSTENVCRESLDAMSTSYEARLNDAFALLATPQKPVIVQETEWWEYALWGASGVAVGALLVGAIWLGVGIGSL